MNRPGLLPIENRSLHRCILLTLLLALLLIAATLWVYERRLQRLRKKLNESPEQGAISSFDGAEPQSAIRLLTFK